MSRSTYKTLYEGYAAPATTPTSKPLFVLPTLPSGSAPAPTAVARSAAPVPTPVPTPTASEKSAAPVPAPVPTPTAGAKSAAPIPPIPPMLLTQPPAQPAQIAALTAALTAAQPAQIAALTAALTAAPQASPTAVSTAAQPPLMVKSISVPGFLNMIKWDKCLTTEGVQIAYMPNNFEFDVSKFISENGLESYIKVSVSPDKKELKLTKLCNPKF